MQKKIFSSNPAPNPVKMIIHNDQMVHPRFTDGVKGQDKDVKKGGT
jgi:hypothetical protein